VLVRVVGKVRVVRECMLLRECRLLKLRETWSIELHVLSMEGWRWCPDIVHLEAVIGARARYCRIPNPIDINVP
jgi:hypothetical protein